VSGTIWHSRVPLRGGGDVALTARDACLITGMRPDGHPWEHLYFDPSALDPSSISLSVVSGGKTLARS
jgi:hypothetical protein